MPGRLEPRTYGAPLVLTAFQLQHEEESGTVTAFDAADKTIRLNPNYHGFQASFALLDYTAPENVRYAYLLEGVDREWIQATGGSQSASYSDLPPGRFTLRVRASNRYGRGPTVESAFRIEVPKSWHETIPFRVVMVLAGIGLIYLLVRLRTAVLERRRKQLELEIVQRTEELHEQRNRLEQANRLLSQLAIHDSLTDLYNRRYFTELLENEHLRSKRSAEPFSLLLMDIDYFKAVNDTYGHLVGDSVIQTVATRIGGCLRVTDTLARYGGEEYIVLLPNTPVSEATILASRILSAVSAEPDRDP